MRSEAARRALLAAAAAILVWAIVVSATGGFVWQAPWGRVSSRDWLRPLLAGLALLVLYAVRWRRHLPADLRPVARLPWPAIAGGAAAMTLLIAGLTLRSTVAAGPDASGYVSQAALLARGALSLPVPEWVRDAPWPSAAETAAPSGYVPAADGLRFAPTYQPGYPLLMAVAQVVAGAPAVFFVVPLLAAVAAWATYRLGARLGGPWAGAIASLLFASSPPVLMMLVQAMSDLPVTACWTLAFLAAAAGRPWAAGAATAAAVLIRPNVVPLALLPALMLLVADRPRIGPLARFALAAAPAPIAIAILNAHHFGSPLVSGYGSLDELYAAGNIAPNLAQYGRWFLLTQTPVILLAAAAPFLAAGAMPARQRWLVTAAVPLVVLALYLPYFVFQPQEWTYLRFLLPAYPAVFAAFGAVIAALWGPGGRPVRRIALVAATAVVAVHGWRFALEHHAFDRRRSDLRYTRAADYVGRLPATSVIAADVHSGPIRFYTGRDVLRFEMLDRAAFAAALAYFDRLGRPVYVVGEPEEIDRFRARFSGLPAVDGLTGTRCADLREAIACRLR